SIVALMHLRRLPALLWSRSAVFTDPATPEIYTLSYTTLFRSGLMVLASLALGHFVSSWWLLLTAFVGLNLVQASITGFCPAAKLFARLGIPAGCAFR